MLDLTLWLKPFNTMPPVLTETQLLKIDGWRYMGYEIEKEMGAQVCEWMSGCMSGGIWLYNQETGGCAGG